MSKQTWGRNLWTSAGVTEVEARWLPEVAKPLIRLSAPLDEPPPHYSAAADVVVTVHNATFGRHEWPMPAQELPCCDAAVQARCFAVALLDGAVLPSMAGDGPLSLIPSTPGKTRCQLTLGPCQHNDRAIACLKGNAKHPLAAA